jgi:predicted kinase
MTAPGPAAAPELAILIGLPGSGKTSFVRARLGGHVHVSNDLMKGSARGAGRTAAQVAEALAAGRSVTVDNVNARVADRAPLIAAARAQGARVVGYLLDTEARECLRRNRAREGAARVPDVAIFVSRKRLQPPTLAEGFDALFGVSAEEGQFSVTPLQP